MAVEGINKIQPIFLKWFGKRYRVFITLVCNKVHYKCKVYFTKVK